MHTVLNSVYVVLMIVVFLGISIFIHELGHFIAARMCGLVVEAFSIGFGPAIWKRKIKGVTYKIALIPGGYVALPQLDPSGMQVIQGDNSAQAGDMNPVEPVLRQPLPPARPWQKIVVSLAGAAGNVILAIVLAWVVYLIDRPALATDNNGGAVIGDVEKGSPAFAAGLRAGDMILAVDGKKVKTWQEFMQITALADRVTMRVAAGGASETRDVSVPTTNNPTFGFSMISGLEEGSLCKVRLVTPGSAAVRAGVHNGDIFRSFNGVRIASRSHLIRMVQETADREVPIEVERKGATLALKVTPTLDKAFSMVRIGIEFDTMVMSPWQQLESDATAIFRILKALITPSQSGKAAKGLGGPVSILGMFWLYLASGLLVPAIAFTRFLNVNLAIVNLLPIPVLDGGHIVFALWEWITRRSVHPKVVTWLVNIFAGLLIVAMVLLTYRDIIRWWVINGEMSKDRAAESTTVSPARTNDVSSGR